MLFAFDITVYKHFWVWELTYTISLIELDCGGCSFFFLSLFIISQTNYLALNYIFLPGCIELGQ